MFTAEGKARGKECVRGLSGGGAAALSLYGGVRVSVAVFQESLILVGILLRLGSNVGFIFNLWDVF